MRFPLLAVYAWPNASPLCILWTFLYPTSGSERTHQVKASNKTFSRREEEVFKSVLNHFTLRLKWQVEVTSNLFYDADSIALAVPCDENGNHLLPGSLPPPRYPVDATQSNPWSPFADRLAFEFADYHFTEVQNSEPRINQALDFWLASTICAGGDANDIPWRTAKDLYRTIDSIKEGSAPWKTTSFRYTGPQPPGTPPKWMLESYHLCFRDPRDILLNQIASPGLQGHFDYTPYMQFNRKGDRVWSNLMSGAWAWQEAVTVFYS